MGDPVLAERMRKLKVKAPVEKIVRTDWIATALNRPQLGPDMLVRIVDLACGHREVTRKVRSCPCSTCHKMILDGEDYEAFRCRS